MMWHFRPLQSEGSMPPASRSIHQAAAEDPRFKQVVNAVQAKVDEAFTATG